MQQPATSYVRSGDYHIAYQAVGVAPPDIVFLGAWFTNVEAGWEFEPVAELQRGFATIGRLILFDKRGTGLSDPMPGASVPVLEDWMDDLRAVLEVCESKAPTIVASGETGALALLFAATYPDRVGSLVLVDCWARLARAPDFPIGLPEHQIEPAVAFIRETWGTGALWDWVAPDADDQSLREGYARYERQSASPGTAARMRRMHYETDVRHVLPLISVPTLVIHHLGNRWVRPDHGRYLAEQIDGAKHVELQGPWFPWSEGMRRELLDEVEMFITGVPAVSRGTRVLTTVMFTDIVGSTDLISRHGDTRWRELLELHRVGARRQISRYRGREVGTTGDGFLAMFDGPARAVQCAGAIVQAARNIGIDVRAGVHTGEVELLHDDIGGLAVHIGARTCELAGAGEVLATRTVKDLVAGSGIEFDHRGDVELRGVAGEWALYLAHV